MAWPCGNPAGTEAAAVPAQHQTCGRGGLCHQNWGLFIKSTWRSRAGWGGTGAWTRPPSASAPGPTPSQDSHFTAWFRVKRWGGGRTGRSTAHRRGGGIKKSTEMVLARSQEHEAVIEA